ncbi:hypothetical protein HBA12_06870 [Tenacibaculum mesophilum]|uniref:hypothetical protein n=1 Tax=Tenacibaculum mesophilum TaxID=104268 RepID=UPI001431AB7A|nr:hypothetical protein [Tenacibaculum mesophilum]KAF9659951.1 hypothetical protein HBA12_06870 [Tenacibaculum mesophilum]
MLKNISKLGTVLNNSEQQSINGGSSCYKKVRVCDGVVTSEDNPTSTEPDLNCHWEIHDC